MPINYSISKYMEAFSKIRKAAEEHSYLWNETVPEEGLHIVRISIDEQQRWAESYGLIKGKDKKLHYYKRGDDGERSHLITIKDIAKDFQRHNNHGCDISLNELGTYFLGQIEEYLKQYQLVASKIDEKVKKKVRRLEKMLSLDSEN
jgi:hypothetical protein